MKPQNCKNILYKCFNLAPLNVTIFILFDKNPLWYLIYINLKSMSSNPMLIFSFRDGNGISWEDLLNKKLRSRDVLFEYHQAFVSIYWAVKKVKSL